MVGSDSQLPLEHLPGKTPHDTLHYAMGDNSDMFVAMAAELLHCQKAGSGANQLLDIASRLTDTSTVSEPPLPCPPPATTALVWECTQPHGARPLPPAAGLPRHPLGALPNCTTATATTLQERHGILVAIVNVACWVEIRR